MAKRVAVVGAGPGGLATAVLLLKKGFEVDLYEASDRVGGRNASLELGDFHFDVGPTFFLMPQVLEEIFAACDRKLSDYVELKRIDPMYTLDYGNGVTLKPHSNPQNMADEIAKFSSRDAHMFWLYRARQEKKFKALLPVLEAPFTQFSNFLKKSVVAALPFVNLRSVYDELADYFEDERVRLAFTFQAKYLGMSPFECPSLFTILPQIEHRFGVWHPVGGCHSVSEALAKLFLEMGGRLHLSTPILGTQVEGRRVCALDIAGQGLRPFDQVVMNADFAHGMKSLFSENVRKKYTNQKLEGFRYSCSTFMLYLGLDRKIEMPHHAIYFAQNYRKNIRELTGTLELSEDPSFYIHHPAATDSTMSPDGKSGLYILVPVPNLDGKTDWASEKQRYRDLVLKKVFERTGIDVSKLIIEEKVTTPSDWQNDYRVYKGAVFSLAHTFDQLLMFRPHNASEEFENLAVVGGGTHPGSGLPTILQSGIIASEIVEKRAQSIVLRIANRASRLKEQLKISHGNKVPMKEQEYTV